MSERTCSIEGCENSRQGRGWCLMHWKRWRNHGSTDLLRPLSTGTGRCSIDGCETACLARQLCSKHYKRWQKHGDPTIIQSKNQMWSEFLRLAALETDECIVWPCSSHAGYGRVTIPTIPGPGRRVLAHVLALEMRTGPRPAGMEAAHAPGICHNRSCMNYRHLRWASRAENVQDMLIDGTKAIGERAAHRLTENDVREIRQQHANGESRKSIAQRFDVATQTVDSITHRRSWAWLD